MPGLAVPSLDCARERYRLSERKRLRAHYREHIGLDILQPRVDNALMEDSIVTHNALRSSLRTKEPMFKTDRQFDEDNERRIAAGERRYVESFEDGHRYVEDERQYILETIRAERALKARRLA